MYFNDGVQITNTPSGIRAAYNTLTFVPNSSDAAYYKVPRTYTDISGHTKEWKSWNTPRLVHIAGGTFSSTPNATGAYYYKNTVFENDLKPTPPIASKQLDISFIPSKDPPAPLK